MSRKKFATLCGLAVSLIPVLLTAQSSNPDAFARGAQGPGRGDGAPTGPAPKNADGKPDISGAWAPNAIRQNVDMVATGVHPPFQAWAEKVYNEHKSNISDRK